MPANVELVFLGFVAAIFGWQFRQIITGIDALNERMKPIEEWIIIQKDRAQRWDDLRKIRNEEHSK